MNELTKEEVLHVANLARINVTEEEIETYKVGLKQILDELNRINEVSADDEILISPTSNNNVYREEVGIDENDDSLKNAPKRSGNYIEIKRFVNDQIFRFKYKRNK